MILSNILVSTSLETNNKGENSIDANIVNQWKEEEQDKNVHVKGMLFFSFFL